MAKNPQQKPPVKNKTAAAVGGTFSPQMQQGVFQPIQAQQQTTQLYQGPVPHPDLLEGFERIVPGSAQRLIQLAEDESRHRHLIERQVSDANVHAQRKQMEIAEYQSKAIFKSDTIGQLSGVIVSISCLVGSIYLAVNGQAYVAVALAAIPTAAVIQAFFAKRQGGSKSPPPNKQ